CRIEIYNPFLIPNTDIRVHMNFHPAPDPDPDGVDCGAGLAAPVPEEPAHPAPPEAEEASAAPGQVEDEWKHDFHPVRFETRALACAFADDPHITSPAIMRHENSQGQTLGFYVVQYGRENMLHLPPYEAGDRFHLAPRRLNVEILLMRTDGHNRLLRAFTTAPGWGVVSGLAGYIQVRLIDRLLHAPSPEVAAESQESSAEPGPVVGDSSSCDFEREVCVLSIAGPPDRGGAIPLNAVALDPLKYPDVDVAAPATPTKNLIVLAPPAAAGITSVTVTTRRGSGTAGTQYTLEPDHMLVVNDKETLTSTRPNTH
ncbi:hypothetical protein LQL77_31955, partial [Rhodococcus cerastii]|nr:hypothetical protein [Rhodococcus cerastii]